MTMFRFFDPKNEIDFVGKFRLSLIIAALVPVVAIVGSLVLGINWGIDFAGGTEMQIQFAKDVPADDIRDVLEDLGFAKHQVQRYGAEGSNEMLVRIERLSTFKPEDMKHIQGVIASGFGGDVQADKIQVTFNANVGDRIMVRLPEPKIENPADHLALSAALQAQHQKLAQILDEKSGFRLRQTKGVGATTTDLNDAIMRDEPQNGMVNYNVHFMGVSDKIAKALSDKFGKVDVRRVEFVDSQVSQQLRTDGALAVFYAILAILIYLAIRFDMFFAPGAVVALVQDTFGAFLVFVFGRYEFDLPSIAALLTVVGVSINNTVVVYDRIRETLPPGHKKGGEDPEVIACVNKAVNDTLSRTINTTLTTLFSSIALWIFAGGVIKSFAIVLTVGLALGAFSSTLAAPATYLLLRRRFGHKNLDVAVSDDKRGPSREDKARGVV
jgi:preprotein translocase subunit SecF